MSLESLWSRAIADAARTLWSLELDPAGLLEPADPKHGDCSASLAFKLAKQLKKAPKAIAAELAGALAGLPHLERADVAGPGYLNLTADRAHYVELARRILSEGAQFGRQVVGDGAKVLLEYVSANPTGPLTIAHARQASIGDTLANCLDFCGYDVTREFYVNDAGNQIRMLGESILARAAGRDVPENGYRGQYVVELAATLGKTTDAAAVAREAAGLLLEAIRKDLADFRVRFDVYTREAELQQRGLVTRLLATMKERGLTVEKDGALWLKAEWVGGSEDRPLLKSDGELVYRTTDFAYHLDKFERGFERLINLMGPDHHAHAVEMGAFLRKMGHDRADSFRVVMPQHCRLMRGTEEVKISKRAATYVTLLELMEEVGVDAARYWFAMRSPNTPMDFDLELAKKQASENPVYYAQYAAVRVSGILRKGAEQGLLDDGAPDLSLIGPPELELLRRLRTFEHSVQKVVELLDPSILHQYLSDLAGAYQRYYELGNHDPALRVLCEDVPTRRMRLAVSRAFQQVVVNTLRLMGVSTPERM